MRTQGTLRLPRFAVAAGLAALTISLVFGCNQASFGGKETGAKGSRPSANGTGNDSTKNPGINGADPAIDPQAYGTPPTNDIKVPGWVQGQPLKDLVDALFAQGNNPTIGDAPGGGGDNGANQTAPGGGQGGGNGNVPVGAPGGGGPGDKGSLFSDASGVLWLPCNDQAKNDVPFKSEFFGKAGAQVRAAGELCPQVALTGDVTLLFVIDHSGSMEGALLEGPNDKTSGGSCGRLRAAQVLAEKYRAMPNVTARAGVVNFSTAARTAAGIAPIDQLPLSANVFCGADLAGFTNYYAAFSEAASVLANIPGKKLVYFVSDGSPTVGLGDARSSGLQAAQALRQIPDVTLFALFVGYTSGSANNPQGYLEQLTGDPKAVRVTANAQELVQAAASLGQPLIGIKKEDITAEVLSASGAREVKIDRLEARKDMPNRYYWVTEPFELEGQVGKPTLSQLDVSATTSFGTTVSARAEITYQMTAP
ncbi:MAG: VWA domain-containing protein [Deltaproteobacteria bacterium]|nr:VWA domain-containing protein [Deltaproteobacteria bacterium]